jgi:hypothetical protein
VGVGIKYLIVNNNDNNNSVVLVRDRNLPIKRPPLVG